MRYIGSIVSLLAVCQCKGAVATDPRQEYHSKITSGERAYLKATREANDALDKQANHSLSTLLDGTEIVVPRNLVQLTNMNGVSPGKVDHSEFLRTQSKAEQGSSDAAYFMGVFYLYGLESLQPNEEIAVKWLRRSAEAGHDDARCALGLLLLYGHGNIKADKTAATAYFRLATESNDSNKFAHWLYGKSLFETASIASSSEVNNDQMIKAAELFEMVANDIPEACHQLAVMYEYGIIKSEAAGTDDNRNYTKAAELYQSASQRGHVESTYHLALMYAYGRGFPQDYAKAAELFRVAATHPLNPHYSSMRYLAAILAHGYSDPNEVPDVDEALLWYDKCSAQSLFDDVKNLCTEERDALINFVDSTKGGNLLE
eukprot:scaffold35968_cov55-Cyclotella_meneghiniana.AAC.4